MLVFMGGFLVWAQVWSKGSCVGNVVTAEGVILLFYLICAEVNDIMEMEKILKEVENGTN